MSALLSDLDNISFVPYYIYAYNIYVSYTHTNIILYNNISVGLKYSSVV